MSEYESLENLKKDCDSIEVPGELDLVIRKAMERGRKKRQVGFAILKPVIATACIVAVIACVNLSPSFASYISKIPGVSVLVSIIQFDKGLQLAAENGFMQEINKSAADKGVKFTIDNVIYDRKKMLIGYSVESSEEITGIGSIHIKSVNGEELTNYFISIPGLMNMARQKDMTWKGDDVMAVKLLKGDETFPEDIVIHCEAFVSNKSGTDTTIKGTWKIDIKLNKKLMKTAPKEFSVNRKIVSEQMDLSVEKVKIYPTTIDVYIKPHSTLNRIVSVSGMYLEDEKVNIYKFDGSANFLWEDGCYVFSFESAYFKPFKHLKLKSEGIYYMPAEDRYITVDLAEDKIIKNYSGYSIKYTGQKRNFMNDSGKIDLMLEFYLPADTSQQGENPLSMMIALDEKGTRYYAQSVSSGLVAGKQDEVRYQVFFNKMKEIPDKLKFIIDRDERNKIGPLEVKLK